MKKIMLFLVVLLAFQTSVLADTIKIEKSEIEAFNSIIVQTDKPLNPTDVTGINIEPRVGIKKIKINLNTVKIITKDSFRLDTHYYINIKGMRRFYVRTGSWTLSIRIKKWD